MLRANCTACGDRNDGADRNCECPNQKARNFQDMVRIQADFMQSLMKAFGEQSLAEAYKAGADMAKKPVSGMS